MYNTRHGRGGMRMPMSAQQTNFVSAGQFKTTESPLIQMPTQQQQQQTPLKSIMKQPKIEQLTMVNDVKSEDDTKGTMDTEDDQPKKTENSISKKERRERRNKRIGKLVRPKNALMVLNELCGGPNLRYEDTGSVNGKYEVSVHIGQQVFKGVGISKNAAKQKAAEAAMKNYICGKVKFNPNAVNPTESAMETDESDDVSWCHLASFALYKLMDSWQDEGDFVPPENLAKVNNKLSQAKPAKQLPENAASMHPLMLLHQMRPGVFMEDFSSEGNPPNIIFTVKLQIDGGTVYGSGPNKKVAKKNCAKAAMEKLYSIQYPPEEPKAN